MDVEHFILLWLACTKLINHLSIDLPKTNIYFISVRGEWSYKFCYTWWNHDTILTTQLDSIYLFSILGGQLKWHLFRIHARWPQFSSLNTTQEMIVPVYKAIWLLKKDAFHSVGNNTGFGFRNGFELTTKIVLQNKTYYVMATLVYWVQMSWNNVFVEIYSLYKKCNIVEIPNLVM